MKKTSKTNISESKGILKFVLQHRVWMKVTAGELKAEVDTLNESARIQLGGWERVQGGSGWNRNIACLTARELAAVCE